MNLSYKILLFLLLPIYCVRAMEPKDDAQGLPPGLLHMAELITQRQSVEMTQDPTGSHRGRSLTADNPNPAALTRTPTTTTDGSTPTASIPVSIAGSKAPSLLPGASVSQVPSPSTSATRLPGLNPELSGSNPDLLASVIPPTVYNGPGDAEFNEIVEKEILPLLDKCFFMWSPSISKKRTHKITQSSDDKSSGGEKSGEEKMTPKKSRSGTGLETVNKELPTNRKEFFQELISKMCKAALLKLNRGNHAILFSRQGLAPFYTFFGINMGEKNPVPLNSLSSVLKPVIENALADYKTAIQKENFKKDCFIYTALAANFAMSTAVFAVGLANYYS